MKNRSWKAAETRMARDVGTERKPCDGSRDGADFTDGIACYQLKVRKSLPTWLWTWLGGIVDTAARDGKIGALVLRTPRMQDREALVIVRWEDWVALHGDARRIDSLRAQLSPQEAALLVRGLEDVAAGHVMPLADLDVRGTDGCKVTTETKR